MSHRPPLDHTHDPALRSWVESANAPGADFPIQNLPFGVFRRRGGDARIGVAIGDQVLDLVAAAQSELLTGLSADALAPADSLNGIMGRGRPFARALRHGLVALLTGENREGARKGASLLAPMNAVELLLPVRIGDYSDFYASLSHATNVGSMFRPDNPLLPNYKHIPIGYHGRASSIVVSGTAIQRPSGQTRNDPNAAPVYGPTQRLDYELELGAYVGAGNPLGAPVTIDRAEEHLWGVSLVNDWSARDVQAWEYQPLGPFLAKSFATSVSPWVVTMDALAPFRIATPARAAGDPQPLPYLTSAENAAFGAMDLQLEVGIRSAAMRKAGAPAMTVSRGRFAEMYWTMAQMLAHHTSNGCNLRSGDLLASGTVSGATPESRGCLLERTWRGSEPLELPTGERRSFLEDGDEVILRGHAEREGYRRIGLGECSGIVIG